MIKAERVPPAVAVSTVAFALQPPPGAQLSEQPTASQRAHLATIWLPLVRRTRAPFTGYWALPGGPIAWNETLVDTALRALHAVVSCDPGYLEQLYSFGAIERSADAQRLVTIAYWALYGEQNLAECAGSRSRDSTTQASAAHTAIRSHHTDPDHDPDPNVAWFSADQLPPLAFDHADIVAHALGRLRSKTEYSTVAYRFLGEHFTLARLRKVHEAILGQPVDPANFRRQVLAQGHLVETGEHTRGARHRPAKLFRFAAPHQASPAQYSR